MMLSEHCLSVAYIGPKSRTERPRKTKIGTEVAHVTRDSDTTLRSKGQRSICRVGVYCGGLPHSLLYNGFSISISISSRHLAYMRATRS